MIKNEIKKLNITNDYNRIYNYFKSKSLDRQTEFLLRAQNFMKNNKEFLKYYNLVVKILTLFPPNKINEANVKKKYHKTLHDVLKLPKLKIIQQDKLKKFWKNFRVLEKIEEHKIAERGRIMEVVEYKDRRYFKKEIILTNSSKIDEAYFEAKVSLDIQKKNKFTPKLLHLFYLPSENKIILLYEYLADYVPIGQYILEKGKLNINQIRIIENYLTKIHELGYFHQDIHSGNVMMNKTDIYDIKIIDFGRARDIDFIMNQSNAIYKENMSYYLKYNKFMKNQVHDIVIFLLVLVSHLKIYTLVKKYKNKFGLFKKTYKKNNKHKKVDKKLVKLMFNLIKLGPLDSKIYNSISVIDTNKIQEVINEKGSEKYLEYLEFQKCVKNIKREENNNFIKINYDITCANIDDTEVKIKKLITSMNVWENRNYYLSHFNPKLLFLPFSPLGNTQIIMVQHTKKDKKHQNIDNIRQVINHFDDLVLLRRFLETNS